MESKSSLAGALTGEAIKARLEKDLFITPILDLDKQITEVSIDFRLGYDFLVYIQGREAFINASLNTDVGETQRNIYQFSQETRRQLGETFILHPGQTVLTTSLEYIKLPDDIMLMLFMRSSYSRLGITISTIVQPGYCGCISLELTNNNKNPVNLTVGARIFQAVFVPMSQSSSYFANERKYICHVRPEPSAAIHDSDLLFLNKLWKKDNQL